MIFVIDLDGTLLTDEKGNYAGAVPIEERVEKVRELFADNNTIIIQTARNPIYYDFTKIQLYQFGIPYHGLSVGAKVYGDIYIDDKGMNANDFF
jgi:hydroxymethylpyrimidine pyrophosphatase-like HAD family hydrolase